MTRLVFLTGAPEADHVDWHGDGVWSSFLPAVRRFLGETVQDASDTAVDVSQQQPKWRRIEIHGSAQNPSHGDERGAHDARFWSFSDDTKTDEDHANFLEHSLAILQELNSSHLEASDENIINETTTLASMLTDNTSSTHISLLDSTTSNATCYSEQPLETHAVHFNGAITDLRGIPNAGHILSIHPQTMTVNLLASVISIQPARTVRTRRNGVELNIIEVLVGDDTRAGFNISFWLSPEASQTKQPPQSNDFRSTLAAIRSGDILLLTNIALSEFQGNVYGQSLSKRITRNNTSIAIISDSITGPDARSAAKLDRVRAWSARFVGPRRAVSPVALGNTARKRRRSLDLPPDTQE